MEKVITMSIDETAERASRMTDPKLDIVTIGSESFFFVKDRANPLSITGRFCARVERRGKEETLNDFITRIHDTEDELNQQIRRVSVIERDTYTYKIPMSNFDSSNKDYEISKLMQYTICDHCTYGSKKWWHNTPCSQCIAEIKATQFERKS